MMRKFLVVLAAVATLSACDRIAAPGAPESAAPDLVDPTQRAALTRAFAPANPAAEAATGAIEVAMTTRMPDASNVGAAPQDIIAFSGAGGYALEAELVGATSPATLVEGQTLRALLGLPVEAAQTLIYRVAREEKGGKGGLCGGEGANFVVIWDSEDAAAPALKAIALRGGQPGETGARACPMLEYQRA